MSANGVIADLTGKLRNGVALRRATRVAVTVPVTMAILLSVPALEDAALFGVFACLAQLLFADFGGPLRDRFLAYVLTTAAGIPLLVIGITFGQSVVGAAIVMFVVAMGIGLAAVLRGLFASAQTVLMLATVLAVTSAPAGTQVTTSICWTIGGLIAALAALVLWPARPSHALSGQLGDLYRSAAEAVLTRWAQPQPELHKQVLAEMDGKIAALHGQYDGNMLRPSGLTNTDRAIAQLVDLVSRLRAYQKWQNLTPPDAPPQPDLDAINATLAATVSDELVRIAADINGNGHDASADRIKRARDQHLTDLTAWVAQDRTVSPGSKVREHIDDTFPLRLSAISTELASASTNPKAEFRDEGLVSELAPVDLGIGARLVRNMSWDSPWFRNAFRSAIALSLSVMLAKSLGLEHGFWIVLGTLTALRFDASGTGRTALQALGGTVAGVLLGAGLILAVGDNTNLWWLLLPVCLLIAAYTPGNFSLAAGQAGFSLVVIVLFSVLYPASLKTAELRLVDVAIGLGVSLTISLVMWPRGVVVTLNSRMADAINAATDHLLMAIDYVAGGAVDRHMLDASSDRSALALDRAREAYDLSIAQKPPQTVPIEKWFRIAIAARHVDAAAHLIPGVTTIVSDRGGHRTIPLELTGAFLESAHDVRDHLRGVVEAWRSQSQGAMMSVDVPITQSMTAQTIGPPGSALVTLRALIDQWLEEPSDWEGDLPDPRPAIVTWTADWNSFIAWNARVVEQALQGSSPSPTH